MEQIIFIAIVVIIGVVRLVAQVTEAKRTADAARRANPSPAQPSTPLAPRGAPQTEEERIRKFLEALGVPTSKDPPPKVQPQPFHPAASPARKILPVDPFPKPRSRTLQAAPPETVVPPPLPAQMPEVRPTRRKPVLAEPRETERAARVAEFGVRDIDEGIEENALSHAGLPIDVGRAKPTAAESAVGRLATQGGLRDAVILREIFGPPRSMQALERPAGG